MVALPGMSIRRGCRILNFSRARLRERGRLLSFWELSGVELCLLFWLALFPEATPVIHYAGWLSIIEK
jgi:hypothetical protein